MKKEFSTLAELFNEMYELAIKNMDMFLTDVLHDTECIANFPKEKIDDLFCYWVVRKHGTQLQTDTYKAAAYARDWKEEYCFTAIIKGGDHCENGGYSLEIIHGEAD